MINFSKVHELLYKLYLDGKSLMVSYDRLKSNNIKVKKNWFKQGTHFLCMLLNPTFNNILFISLRSVLLVEETGVSGENDISHNVVSSTPRLSGVGTHNFSGDRWLHR